jgi:hypothetical protein
MMTRGSKSSKEETDHRGHKGQGVTALALFRTWCEAADAWKRQKSDVTEARCRAARNDYYRASLVAQWLASPEPIAEPVTEEPEERAAPEEGKAEDAAEDAAIR